MRAVVGLVLLAATLTACGNDADRKTAETFCADEMRLDEYRDSEGFDRCVEDVIPVVDCLDAPRAAATAWVPRDCENDGYNP